MGMVSSVVGANVRNRIIYPIARMMPPQLSIVSLSLTLSHKTEHKRVWRLCFLTSLKEKLSAMSSMLSRTEPGVPEFRRNWREHATKTIRPREVSVVFPSNPEWRIPSL
jgi:hypothetical protein